MNDTIRKVQAALLLASSFAIALWLYVSIHANKGMRNPGNALGLLLSAFLAAYALSSAEHNRNKRVGLLLGMTLLFGICDLLVIAIVLLLFVKYTSI